MFPSTSHRACNQLAPFDSLSPPSPLAISLPLNLSGSRLLCWTESLQADLLRDSKRKNPDLPHFLMGISFGGCLALKATLKLEPEERKNLITGATHGTLHHSATAPLLRLRPLCSSARCDL